MNINVNSWHFKVFRFFGSSDRHYLNGDLKVDICQYFRTVAFNIFFGLLVAILVLFFGTLILLILLEPFFVLGNYLLGNGWEPVLDKLVNEEPTLGMAGAGAMLWGIGAALFGFHFTREWWRVKKYEVAESGTTSFTSVAYERFRSWKGKYCTMITFTKE